MGSLSPDEYQGAQERVEVLSQSWREIQPQDSVRSLAGSLLHQFPLRAADALQLAAAVTWSHQQPQRFAFLSGDKQLLAAAKTVGFRVVEV